jgi:hypothetical protein
METSVTSLVAPLSNRLWAKFFARRDRERELCIVALDRIDNEKHHFDDILKGKTYGSKDSHKAATVTSFDLLGRDCRNLSLISRYWPFNWRLIRHANRVANLADKRDAAVVLSEIERIKPLLRKRIGGMSDNRHGKSDF